MTGIWWVRDADLDESQARAVQGMPEDSSFLVRGPAGSGKTNILLLRAKWLRIKGKSELKIVVFTRTLRDFIRLGCEEYGIPQEDVLTSAQFFRRILAEYGVKHEASATFEEDRTLLAGELQTLIESQGIKDIFDAVLVDETQDYLDTELHIFRKLSPRLIMATDSRQSIYRTTPTRALLEALVGGNVISLKYHYRTGLKICQIADGIVKDSINFAPMHGDSKYDEDSRPSSLELIACDSLEVQFQKIVGRLQAQLDAYPDELVGILFPKREQVSAFVDELGRHDFGPEGNRIRVDTMHGAKGLEFRAVHIGATETLYRMGATQKRLIYTSILRGRTAVAIYHSGPLPGYIESAVAKASPPRANPKLSELFGKGP